MNYETRKKRWQGHSAGKSAVYHIGRAYGHMRVHDNSEYHVHQQLCRKLWNERFRYAVRRYPVCDNRIYKLFRLRYADILRGKDHKAAPEWSGTGSRGRGRSR